MAKRLRPTHNVFKPDKHQYAGRMIRSTKAVRQSMSYYMLSAKLPMELVLQILSLLDSKSINAITAEVLSSQWDDNYLWRIFEAHVLLNTDIFYEEAISCQFPLIASIFTRDLVPWTFCSNSSLWGSMAPREAFGFYEYMDSRTETGVRAIQRGLPLKMQTSLIRFYFLHLWLLYSPSTRCPPESRFQESWNYFAALSLCIRTNILGFFNHLTYSFLNMFPPRYPVEATCQLGGSNNRRRRTSWRLPTYIASELEQLGVTEFIAKQLVIRKVAELCNLLNTTIQEPLDPFVELELLNFFHPKKSNGYFWSWNNKFRHAIYKTSTSFVMRMDDHTYEVWVYGSRGNGRIELWMPRGQVYERMCSNWVRLFDDAMTYQRKKNEPLPVIEWMLHNLNAPSYVIKRKRYWCWTEWDVALELDSLYLNWGGP